MIEVRLLVSFRCHHHEIPEGTVVGLPAEMASRFTGLGLAEYAGPRTAVVEPEEKRTTGAPPRVARRAREGRMQ